MDYAYGFKLVVNNYSVVCSVCQTVSHLYCLTTPTVLFGGTSRLNVQTLTLTCTQLLKSV